MNSKIENMLKKLVDNGFDAYVVGGYVRDYLLGIKSYDVDISTTANPNEIRKVFNISSTVDNYGRITVKDSLYSYDIMPYREELKFENRKPVEYEFTKDINKDIFRRDFTVNCLYMDINGEIFDPFNGKEDIENKVIRTIGDIETRMVDDPLRILRAIRFATILDFEIEDNLFNFIKNHKDLIKLLSKDRVKKELDKIFKSSNKIKGLELIEKLGLNEILGLKYNEVVYTLSSEGIWAQMEDTDYNFSNQEKSLISAIKNIINYGIIDNIVLYQYGLYPCIIGGEILGINAAQVSNIYKDLPIYSKNDINFTGNDIIDVLNIEPGVKIKQILDDLELNILNGDLENKKDILEKYVLDNWR